MACSQELLDKEFLSGEVRRSKDENKNLTRKADILDRDRALRLQRAAQAGEIIRTKNGVFQSSPCTECGLHHRVALSLMKQAPCPATELGMKYYSMHGEELHKMESFSLNKLAKSESYQATNNASRQAGTAKTGNTLLSKTQSWNKSLPRLTVDANEGSGNIHTEVRSKSSMGRPKTAQGRLPRRRARSSEHVSRTTTNKAGKKETSAATLGGITWNDIFAESHLNSVDSSLSVGEKGVGTMRRQLMREMFAQEETALRLRLSQEKEMYYHGTRKLKSLEKENALADIKSSKTIELLKRRLCIAMEQEIVLGVAKVTLDDYYRKFRRQSRGQTREVYRRGCVSLGQADRQSRVTPSKKELAILPEDKKMSRHSQEYQEMLLQLMREKHETEELQNREEEAEQVSKERVQSQPKVSEVLPEGKKMSRHSPEYQEMLLQFMREKHEMEEQQKREDEIRNHLEQISKERAESLSDVNEPKEQEGRKQSRQSPEYQEMLLNIMREKHGLVELQERRDEAAASLLELHHESNESKLSPKLGSHVFYHRQLEEQTMHSRSDYSSSATHSAGAQRVRSAPLKPIKTVQSGSPLMVSKSHTYTGETQTCSSIPPTTLTQTTSITGGNGLTSSSSSTSDVGTFQRRDKRSRLGPTTISPRPTSAHPTKRPDLYANRKVMRTLAEANSYSEELEGEIYDDNTMVSFASMKTTPIEAATHGSSTPNEDSPAATHGTNTVTFASEKTTPYESVDESSAPTRGSNTVVTFASQKTTPIESIDDLGATNNDSNTMVAFESEYYANKDPALASRFSSNIKQPSKYSAFSEPSLLHKGSFQEQAISNVELSGSNQGKEVNFMVSLPRKDSPQDQSKFISDVPSSESSLVDDTKVSTTLCYQDSEMSDLPSPQGATQRRRKVSNIATHVDSLDLIEHGGVEPQPLMHKESAEIIIARTRRLSSIVHHVDSLMLLEQSKPELVEDSQSKLEDEDKTDSEEEEEEVNLLLINSGSDLDVCMPKYDASKDTLQESDSRLVVEGDSGLIAPPSTPTDFQQSPSKSTTYGSKSQMQTHAAICMADIQKELRQLEENIALTKVEDEADYYKITTDDEAEVESVDRATFRDSMAIPTIFVSPYNSEGDIATHESQLILLKAQEIANKIINKAIDINIGMESEDAESPWDLDIADLYSPESQIILVAREIVHDIVQKALEINTETGLLETEEGLAETMAALDLVDLCDSVNDDGTRLEPVQSLVLIKAKSMVHNAVAKAVENVAMVNSVDAVLNLPADTSRMDTAVAQLMMYKAHVIVNRVIERAIEMNQRRFESGIPSDDAIRQIETSKYHVLSDEVSDEVSHEDLEFNAAIESDEIRLPKTGGLEKIKSAPVAELAQVCSDESLDSQMSKISVKSDSIAETKKGRLQDKAKEIFLSSLRRIRSKKKKSKALTKKSNFKSDEDINHQEKHETESKTPGIFGKSKSESVVNEAGSHDVASDTMNLEQEKHETESIGILKEIGKSKPESVVNEAGYHDVASDMMQEKHETESIGILKEIGKSKPESVVNEAGYHDVASDTMNLKQQSKSAGVLTKCDSYVDIPNESSLKRSTSENIFREDGYLAEIDKSTKTKNLKQESASALADRHWFSSKKQKTKSTSLLAKTDSYAMISYVNPNRHLKCFDQEPVSLVKSASREAGFHEAMRNKSSMPSLNQGSCKTKGLKRQSKSATVLAKTGSHEAMSNKSSESASVLQKTLSREAINNKSSKPSLKQQSNVLVEAGAYEVTGLHEAAGRETSETNLTQQTVLEGVLSHEAMSKPSLTQQSKSASFLKEAGSLEAARRKRSMSASVLAGRETNLKQQSKLESVLSESGAARTLSISVLAEAGSHEGLSEMPSWLNRSSASLLTGTGTHEIVGRVKRQSKSASILKEADSLEAARRKQSLSMSVLAEVGSYEVASEMSPWMRQSSASVLAETGTYEVADREISETNLKQQSITSILDEAGSLEATRSRQSFVLSETGHKPASKRQSSASALGTHEGADRETSETNLKQQTLQSKSTSILMEAGSLEAARRKQSLSVSVLTEAGSYKPAREWMRKSSASALAETGTHEAAGRETSETNLKQQSKSTSILSVTGSLGDARRKQSLSLSLLAEAGLYKSRMRRSSENIPAETGSHKVAGRETSETNLKQHSKSTSILVETGSLEPTQRKQSLSMSFLAKAGHKVASKMSSWMRRSSSSALAETEPHMVAGRVTSETNLKQESKPVSIPEEAGSHEVAINNHMTASGDLKPILKGKSVPSLISADSATGEKKSVVKWDPILHTASDSQVGRFEGLKPILKHTTEPDEVNGSSHAALGNGSKAILKETSVVDGTTTTKLQPQPQLYLSTDSQVRLIGDELEIDLQPSTENQPSSSKSLDQQSSNLNVSTSLPILGQHFSSRSRKRMKREKSGSTSIVNMRRRRSSQAHILQNASTLERNISFTEGKQRKTKKRRRESQESRRESRDSRRESQRESQDSRRESRVSRRESRVSRRESRASRRESRASRLESRESRRESRESRQDSRRNSRRDSRRELEDLRNAWRESRASSVVSSVKNEPRASLSVFDAENERWAALSDMTGIKNEPRTSLSVFDAESERWAALSDMTGIKNEPRTSLSVTRDELQTPMKGFKSASLSVTRDEPQVAMKAEPQAALYVTKSAPDATGTHDTGTHDTLNVLKNVKSVTSKATTAASKATTAASKRARKQKQSMSCCSSSMSEGSTDEEEDDIDELSYYTVVSTSMPCGLYCGGMKQTTSRNDNPARS